MNDPYRAGDIDDPEAFEPGDAEDQALQRMEETASTALIVSAVALVVPFCQVLGIVGIVLGLRARSIGAPHALSPPGSANGAIVVGAIALPLGFLYVVLVAVWGLARWF